MEKSNQTSPASKTGYDDYIVENTNANYFETRNIKNIWSQYQKIQKKNPKSQSKYVVNIKYQNNINQ